VSDDWKENTGRAMLVAAHGHALVLCYAAPYWLEQLVVDSGGRSSASIEPFELDEAFDHGDVPNGVSIAEITMVDDGPGDWPGSRETIASFKVLRPATAEEWRSHLTDEWPWETPEWLTNERLEDAETFEGLMEIAESFDRRG
jgi:hypothetical protein